MKNRLPSLAALLVLALVLSLALTACGASTVTLAPESQTTQITVSASSSVRLVPDKANVSFGVTTHEETAESAQSANNEAVDRVIAVLTENGVEERSIRTTNYSMYPSYDYGEDGKPTVSGYDVYTTLSVSDQNVEDVGKLINACVSAGINNVNDVSFFCSGYDEAYSQALEQALADAKTKAEGLAAAAGKELGEVVTIAEGWQDTSARYDRNDTMSFSMDVEEGAGDADIQPGETEISANVTVTFQLN